MFQLARRLWGHVLNADQENRPTNIDSQETQLSSEASSTDSSFYLVAEGITENSSMSSKDESIPEPEMSSLSRRLGKIQLDDLKRSGAPYSDNFRKSLERELDLLRTRQAKLIRRVNGRMQELETLRRQNEEEQWEDDLFETRMKELEAANVIIETRSSVSQEDIIIRVKEINEQIIHISSVSVVARPGRPHISHLYGAVTNALGSRFIPFFKKIGYYFEEQTVKIILQIYLARLCATVIYFWSEEEDLNNRLDQLYRRIAVNESQLLAGKWRQVAFKHLPRGLDQEGLQQLTVNVVDIIVNIACCAGWGGGNISEIRALVEDLVVKAGTVREYTKSRLISADIQPWVAEAGDVYDPATMEVENGSGMGGCVLGSTSIGLGVSYASKEDSVTLQLLLPSKVVCVRS